MGNKAKKIIAAKKIMTSKTKKPAIKESVIAARQPRVFDVTGTTV